jgi:hypothetical protein
MSFAIFKGETTMKDLVTRLFRLPDKSPTHCCWPIPSSRISAKFRWAQ